MCCNDAYACVCTRRRCGRRMEFGRESSVQRQVGRVYSRYTVAALYRSRDDDDDDYLLEKTHTRCGADRGDLATLPGPKTTGENTATLRRLPLTIQLLPLRSCACEEYIRTPPPPYLAFTHTHAQGPPQTREKSLLYRCQKKRLIQEKKEIPTRNHVNTL